MGAILLIQDYGDNLECSIKELIGEIEKRKIMNQLEQADLFGVIQGLGFKKGRSIFTNWRRKQLARIEEINDEMHFDELPIFEKLKKQDESKTIFERLIKNKGE